MAQSPLFLTSLPSLMFPSFFLTSFPPLTLAVLLLSFVLGVGIGLFYFGGLWWTTQQVPHRRSPALWLLGSFALRTLLAGVAFYLVMQGRPERLLVCLFGFWIARYVCIRVFGQITPKKASPLNKDLPSQPRSESF
ncbi:ATP synthase subunit I [Myxococcota bacterium]|nr:ATP synthase subunit I [Myxococcota bacterium]